MSSIGTQCFWMWVTALCTMSYSAPGDLLHFDALTLYNTFLTWKTPATLIITNCRNISILVISDTSPCCNAVMLTNSSCAGCSNNHSNQCIVKDEEVDYRFKGNASISCSANTSIKLECLECQRGYCSQKGAEIQNTSSKTSTYATTTATKTTDISTESHHPTGQPTSATEAAGSTSTIQHSIQVIGRTPGTTTTFTRSTSASETSSVVQDSYNSTNSTFNETSTEQPFDIEQSKKDLYTFLAALGASLLLVFIIVCVFFVRKNRSKLPVVNISEEFWSSKDYIPDIDDEGNLCGSGAHYSVINPLYHNKSYRDPSIYCNSVESLAPKYVKTETFRPSYTSYSPQVNGDCRLEQTGRTATPTEREPVCSTDDEAGVVLDLTKIVTNEIKSQQRARNIEDRKIITRDSPNTSTGGHYRKGKRNRDSRQRSRSGQRAAEDPTRTRGHGVDSDQLTVDDLYAVSYKNRFREYLDQCSAEESDV